MDQSVFRSLVFTPGVGIKKPEPLSRYLPPIPDGVISAWLLKNVLQGSWILDPFGASPRLAVEAARAGYRLLVTANNPVARFLLEISANPPRSMELRAALAELSASYKGQERIEPHIRSLYNTLCARCGQLISAEAFLWEQGNPAPYARIYTCPFCGDSGEHACTPYDIDRASQFSISGMHKARALERVVAAGDQDRIHVEQALSVYIPRALYALITIVNKIEGLSITPAGQRYLAALLLHTFDQSNAMWRVSGAQERRRQLAVPRQFRENNIWMALEQGIDLLSSDSSEGMMLPVPISIWPDQPPASGGICISEGRLISIADSLKDLDIKSVCAAIPRPNQAFWTLSALWAGWLWGREAVGTFKSVLHRQRYDWAWHATALSSVFRQLVSILKPSTTILGLIGESEPGFIASALVAARFAGCDLQGMAVRTEEERAQLVWMTGSVDDSSSPASSLTETGAYGARSYLEIKGEPASYLNTICAAFINILKEWSPSGENIAKVTKAPPESQSSKSEPPPQSEPSPSVVYSTIYNAAREALSYRSGFLRFNIQNLTDVEPQQKTQIIQETLFSLDLGKIMSDEDELAPTTPSSSEIEQTSEKERPTRSSDITESVLLWLREAGKANRISISDQYELTILNYLISHPQSTTQEISSMMCDRFPGLFTPDNEFIRICLESYGEKDTSDDQQWHIRPEDHPEERHKDIDNAYNSLHEISAKLGIQSDDRRINDIASVSWTDDNGELDYWFFPTITANIGRIVFECDQPNRKGIIVLPGSRANLVIYKLRRDPRLNKAFNPNIGTWRFLKLRHLRSLAENPTLTRENLDQLLKLDPLTYTAPQLRMI